MGYERVKFIKIQDNNNPNNFYIDSTTMKDHRLRVSSIKGQYWNYLDTGLLFRPVYDILGKDYSFSLVETGSFKNYNEVKERKKELYDFYREKYSKCEIEEKYIKDSKGNVIISLK
jgi:hypothetical protein